MEKHLPTFISIVVHLNPLKSKKILKKSPTDITELFFFDRGEEKITKKLNRVSEKINSNKNTSRQDALDFGNIVLYVPRYKACEMTQEVIGLYKKISKFLDFNLEYTLYMVITIMIDAYFDDETEYRRLIDMMDDATSNESISKSESEIATLQRLQWREEDLAEAIDKLDTVYSKLDEAYGKLDTVYGKLDTVYGKLDTVYGKLDTVYGKLDEAYGEIARLKNGNK